MSSSSKKKYKHGYRETSRKQGNIRVTEEVPIINPVNPTYEALSKVLLNRNRNLNFVDRAINPESYPVIQNKDNTVSTHLMSYATDDNANAYVYPEIIYNNNQLQHLSPDAAQDYAFDNNQYIKTQSPKLAEYFSSVGYKKKLENGATMKVKIKKVPKAQNGLTVENDQFSFLSPSFIELGGKKHSKGGTDIAYNGQVVEAEQGETLAKDNQDNLVVYGNMLVPGTNRKFKNVAKDIARKEQSAYKALDESIELIENNKPHTKLGSLAFNSGIVLNDASKQNFKASQAEKQQLADTQEFMLNLSKNSGKSPDKISSIFKNGGKISYKKGGKVSKKQQEIRDIISEEAQYQGVDPDLMLRLADRESPGQNTKAKSSAGALGVMQLMEDTAKMYGVNKNQLTSDDPDDIRAVVRAGVTYYRDMLDKYNGDPILALAAYNGPGSIPLAQKDLEKEDITGEDWLRAMEARRERYGTKDNTKWRTQTYDYVTNIMNLDRGSQSLGQKPSYQSINPTVGFYDETTGYQSNRIPMYPNQKRQLQPYDNSGEKGKPEEQGFAEYDSGNNQPQGIDLSMWDNAPQKVRDELARIYNTDNTTIPQSTGRGFQQMEPLQPMGRKPIAMNNFQQPVYTPISPSNPMEDGDEKKKESLADRNKLGITDILPELIALGDSADYVQGQRYEPQLFQPYQVSFQDRLNENNRSFRTLAQQLPNNAPALSILAAQKYNADNQVLADEFRTNQQLSNQVTNQNVGLLNQARLKNIELADMQYARQEQARANTDAYKQQALASISNKFAQNRKDNMNIRLMENMYNYRPDAQGQMQYVGPDWQYTPYTSPFGYQNAMSAQPTRQTIISDNSGNIMLNREQYDYLENQMRENKLRQQQANMAKKATSKWGSFLKKNQ